MLADRQHRFAQAQPLYEQALRFAPDDAEILSDLGYSFYLSGQLDKAESALLKAVARAPAEPRHRNNLGLVYGHQRRLPEALECFRKAGSEADAQYNLAFVLASQGEAEKAEECFHLALAADSSYSPARRALANFSRYRRDPEGIYDQDEIVSGGVRYIPYVESNQPNTQPNHQPNIQSTNQLATAQQTIAQPTIAQLTAAKTTTPQPASQLIAAPPQVQQASFQQPIARPASPPSAAR